ncbi:MAG: serpin family protein, partial [Candidatus Thorarchaeota archaeon]
MTSINKFAIDLYEKLKGTDGNLFLSPYSAGVALAMTYAGAHGETEKEIAEVLHFELDKWQIHTTFEKLIGFLQIGDDQIKVGNALWIQQNFGLLDSFIDTIEMNYGKIMFEVDFSESETTRKQINDWVKKKTKDKIEEILQPRMITAITRLVLTNAIHFKSDWSSKFKAKDTNDAPFKLLNGQEIQVPMMYQKAQFGYFETDKFQILELPYEGSDFSLVVFLPRKVNGLPAIEKMLKEEKVELWISSIKYQRVKA